MTKATHKVGTAVQVLTFLGLAAYFAYAFGLPALRRRRARQLRTQARELERELEELHTSPTPGDDASAVAPPFFPQLGEGQA